eukprot:5443892-Amphidinium_carterae.1
MEDEIRKQYVTITSAGVTVKGWKETTLIIGTITTQVCFIVAHLQSPSAHTGNKPYIRLH